MKSPPFTLLLIGYVWCCLAVNVDSLFEKSFIDYINNSNSNTFRSNHVVIVSLFAAYKKKIKSFAIH